MVIGIWLALTGPLAACDGLTPEERRTVRRWLVCEECTDGEQDSVAQLGNDAVRALARALRGPPGQGRRNIRVQAEGMYDRVVPPPANITRDEYADEAVANYVATYQIRAARALHRINTPAAHAVLVVALRDFTRYRDDVLPVVGQAAGALLSILEGDGQQALVDSFVTVDPRVRVSDSTNGEGMLGVRVVFRIDSGAGRVSDSVRFTGSDGEAHVRWRLGLDPGTNVLRASAAGKEVRFQATAH